MNFCLQYSIMILQNLNFSWRFSRVGNLNVSIWFMFKNSLQYPLTYLYTIFTQQLYRVHLIGVHKAAHLTPVFSWFCWKCSVLASWHKSLSSFQTYNWKRIQKQKGHSVLSLNWPVMNQTQIKTFVTTGGFTGKTVRPPQEELYIKSSFV